MIIYANNADLYLDPRTLVVQDLEKCGNHNVATKQLRNLIVRRFYLSFISTARDKTLGPVEWLKKILATNSFLHFSPFFSKYLICVSISITHDKMKMCQFVNLSKELKTFCPINSTQSSSLLLAYPFTFSHTIKQHEFIRSKWWRYYWL